ncbi:U-box domain-containing protein 5-like isoform X2 [Herrania umbratica]|uniref:RING-type E3 ubiquitin transferase n=1 Tax=Herrania umbratica TaxID=108875 RepID=A0A6J1ADD3_9ROSI|nr:U-box domain-containing protein 5-like isoform X2 [Herrania umbratica]
MEFRAAESVELPYYITIKVHRLMCLELKKIIDSILQVFSDLESARPCSSGMQALCLLQSTMDKAKLLIQHCSESSKLYLAITAKAILWRCDKIRKTLAISMNQVQDMVPPLLAEKISRIIDELRSARFPLEPSEYEAGAVILALLQQDTSASGSKLQSEIEALQLATLRLNILSPFALLIEQRSIKILLGKVHDREPVKRKILNYLLYLLKKHGKLIWQLQSKITSPEEDNCSSSMEQQHGGGKEEDETPPNDFFIPKPPEEFQCPISMRLLCDPVIIASGKTFERVWIERWFNEGNQICPVTNTRLEQLSITPNLAMKGLISKWCLRYGIHIPEHAKPIPSLLSSWETSSRSIASFGSSVLGLQLQIGNVSIGSMSTGSTLDSSDRTPNDELAADSHCQRCHLSSVTLSSHDINAAFLSELDKYSWKSKCKAVENVKGLLEDNDKASRLTFSSSHVNPVITFLKDANEMCDIKMQKDGAEVLLAILSSNRIEFPPCHEDVIYLLASLLDSEPARESLAIMEVLSWQQYYKSRIVASGVLPSILKVLDTTATECYTLAMKILRNLSDCSDVGYHIAYLGYIPKLVSFLEDSNVAGYCIEIINNLCKIDQVRFEVTEANLFTSIARLLEDGKEEQELAVDLLLSLCYEDTWYCQMIMTGSIIQSLLSIHSNSSSRAAENAFHLIELLEHMKRSDASQCSVPSYILSQENSHFCSSNEGKGSSSQAFGFLIKKASRFLRGKC